MPSHQALDFLAVSGRRFTYLGRTVPGVGFLQQLLEPGSIGSHLLRASVRRGLPLVAERLTRFRQR
jgi:hypothetical protein